MKVLVIRPREIPEIKEIGNTLEELQNEVGGDIEAIYPYEDRVALICNEEGKFNGMELNRALRDADGEIYDIIAGSFLITGISESDFCDLNDELLKKYARQFRHPESFARFNGKIVAIPIPIRERKTPAEREER